MVDEKLMRLAAELGRFNPLSIEDVVEEVKLRGRGIAGLAGAGAVAVVLEEISLLDPVLTIGTFGNDEVELSLRLGSSDESVGDGEVVVSKEDDPNVRASVRAEVPETFCISMNKEAADRLPDVVPAAAAAAAVDAA